MRRTLQITLLALACSAPAAWATDLLQAWQAAQQNDRELAVARAAQATAQPRRDQAAALWRPGVAFTATAGVATGESSMRGAQHQRLLRGLPLQVGHVGLQAELLLLGTALRVVERLAGL